MVRKNVLTEDEYQKLVLRTTKRNTSMYESCLLPAEMKPHPRITAHRNVQASLEQDRRAFEDTYGAPSGGTGRYVAGFVTTPQHTKFTKERHGMAGRSESKDTVQRPKFNIPTLRKWFNEIDDNRTGSVSRRELIVALRQHKDLQQVLLSTTEEDPAEAMASSSSANKDPIEGKKAELKRIISIMHEVDTDNSGSMEWEEFVEFFRRSGFLLEYNTRATLNDASFKRDGLMDIASKGLNIIHKEKLGIGEAQLEAGVRASLSAPSGGPSA